MKRERTGTQRATIGLVAAAGLVLSSPRVIHKFNSLAPSYMTLSETATVAHGSALTSAAVIGWILLAFTRRDERLQNKSDKAETERSQRQKILLRISQEVDLSGINLEGAHLRSVDLTGKSLRDSNLENAELLGALLIRTDLRRANICGADLRNVTLEESMLDGLRWDSRTRFDADSPVAEALSQSVQSVDNKGATTCTVQGYD